MAILLSGRAERSIIGLYSTSNRNSIQQKLEVASLLDALKETVNSGRFVASNNRRGILGSWSRQGYSILETSYCFVRAVPKNRNIPMQSKKTQKRKWYFACVMDYRNNTLYIADAVFGSYIDSPRVALPNVMNFVSSMRGVVTKKSKAASKAKQLRLPLKEKKQSHRSVIKESQLRRIIREALIGTLYS